MQISWLEANKWCNLDPPSQLSLLEFALAHQDDVVLPSGVGILSESYTAPANDVFIEGICQEKTLLRQPQLLNKRSPTLKFICLRRMATTGCDGSDRDSSSESDEDNSDDSKSRSPNKPCAPTPILKLNSFSLLDTQAAVSVGMDAAVRCLRIIRGLVRDKSPSEHLVLFCGDTVDNTLQFVAAKHSIIIVSCCV
jgi:hypothetical protein